jgi:hypothetical protein
VLGLGVSSEGFNEIVMKESEQTNGWIGGANKMKQGRGVYLFTLNWGIYSLKT